MRDGKDRVGLELTQCGRMGRREKAQKREGEAPPEEAGEGRIKHGELLVRLSGLRGEGRKVGQLRGLKVKQR